MAYKLQTIRSGATQLPEEMIDFLTVKMIATGGIFDKDNGDFHVTEKPAPSLGVTVKMGAAWVKKADGSMVYPVNLETEDAVLAVGANASGNPRIDAVVLYVDLAASPNAGGTNVAILAVVAGSPAASPVAPSDSAILTAIGASNPFIRLANVTVANGASTILNANISDQRTNIVVAESFNQDFEVGDIKSTLKSTLVGRWLLMDTKTIGGTGSTADYKGDKYKALFDYLTGTLGYAPTAAWAANGKVALPDSVDRFLSGAGTAALGSTGGASTHLHTTGDHTLTEAEIPSHTHIQNAHNHTQNAHAHTTPSTPNNTGGQATAAGGGSSPSVNITNSSTTATNNAATATNQSTGGGGAHNHGNTGSGSHVPKYLAVNHFIKY